MTDTTDTAAVPAVGDAPLRLSPRDESRIALAITVSLLGERALDATPVREDIDPGDLLRSALDLLTRAEQVVARAVVAERERGTTWDQIGTAAGTTRQSAHEKWYPDVRAWAANGHSSLSDSTKNSLEYAAEADATYARLRPTEPHAVTSGLNAVRFPGSQAYEQALPGATLHSRLQVLREEARALDTELKRLNTEDSPFLVADNRAAMAQNEVAIANVYDEIVTAELSLVEEHRGEAERHRGYAQSNRDYAAKLRGEKA
ncbi:hypothetical protein OG894_00135 [Streptomyces sp. NBC_01724]|uniref:hypothetical protein n=1 Tax=unclassified Streptomyces TaxID=2593676 RepID=UPI002E329D04|nr:hypothetical protein [Streptomyces sp. NBC_01724]WTE56720.1 hypothetical protein OG987_42430 [Streptomyces sp. NBC_01620]WTE57327.1 hypothetical protein OG784_00115 [Streptomyces sp. NBC_01617]WTI84844.1 hypothetical protein OHB17_00515 [Streptomyces sp. NBC_00724]WTE64801.1 hypothetical protein OG784_42230 [Streptomyces sp. NBC_01617]WTI92082.1 hypothetical protein OHB17_41490 [Streptomyces sp. NBC_00724]